MGKSKKNNKKEKETGAVDKTASDPIDMDELDAMAEAAAEDADDMPIAMEMLLMAFENFKKHGLQYPPGVQFEVDGFIMEMEDSLKNLVAVTRGYIEVEDEEEHPFDCECKDCVIIENEAGKIPGVRETEQARA